MMKFSPKFRGGVHVLIPEFKGGLDIWSQFQGGFVFNLSFNHFLTQLTLWFQLLSDLIYQLIKISLEGFEFKLSKPKLNHNSTQPYITLSWVRHENDFANHPTTETQC